MLSYKHGFHAGNHADVLKHIVLIYLYNLIKKRTNSISYIDTHAGSGRYSYLSKYMDKNKEYNYGINKIEKYTGKNKLIINYLNKLKIISKNKKFYPGSPYIISNLSNKSDKIYLCELHNNEFEHLKKNMKKFTNIKLIKTDGFKFIKYKVKNNDSFFILIDPPFEIKTDIEEVKNIINNLEEKFDKSRIIIWYPILSYSENDDFINDIRKKGINNLINIELPIKSDDDSKGMKGSGLLLINFYEKNIIKKLKELAKDLQFFLKQNDDIYKPKVRYL